MASKPREDKRRSRIAKICLALPQAVRRDSGPHSAFRVKGRTFAYYLDDHHGDGIVSVNCKAAGGENEALVTSAPTRYYLPAYLARHGWVGLRLDVGTVDWDAVEELVHSSYRLIATTRLAGRA
jgi:predicted DNA-binding protein (MmcQ/YjbR family)